MLSLVIFISTAVLAESPEKQIAVVNGTVVTEGEYLRELDRYSERILAAGRSLDELDPSEVKKTVLENITGMILMYQKSLEEGITIDIENIDKELENVKAMYPDEKAFHDFLEQNNASEEIIRTQIVRGTTIQKFIKEQFIDKISIDDNEVKSFYEKNPAQFIRPEAVKVSHILIKVDPSADDDQREKAKTAIEELHAKVKSGEDFVELAKQHSQGPNSEKGGDLGFIVRGQTPKPIEEAAFKLKPGDVSNIIQTEIGYHLIKATEKQEEGSYSFDEVKDSLKRYLKETKVLNSISEYVTKLRAGADIKIF